VREINNIHDKYFKEFMENPDMARKLLEVILPQELKEIIELSHLIPQKDSFISKDLKEAYSDLLFKSKLREGEEVYIYFLIEHKSYFYEYTSLQLLKYMLNIWEREIDKENQKKLTPVIPVVFYHGEEKWRIPSEFRSLIKGIEKYPVLGKYIPDFRHILFELKPETDIENLKELAIKLFLRTLLLRRKVEEEGFEIFFERVFWEIKELPDEQGYLFAAIMFYIIETVEGVDITALKEYTNRILPERGSDIVTIAEKLREEGRKEGMEKGIERGIEKTAINALKKGFDVKTIAELTGLPIEKIGELKKQLN